MHVGVVEDEIRTPAQVQGAVEDIEGRFFELSGFDAQGFEIAEWIAGGGKLAVAGTVTGKAGGVRGDRGESDALLLDPLLVVLVGTEDGFVAGLPQADGEGQQGTKGSEGADCQ